MVVLEMFSTAWLGLFSGSVRVRFFHRYVFSTTSRLRFWVRSGSFFGADPVFSITSRVRFSKIVFFCPTHVMFHCLVGQFLKLAVGLDLGQELQLAFNKAVDGVFVPDD